MHPPQLEQTVMASFSSSSILHTTGSFSANADIRPGRFIRRNSHRLEKQTDWPVLYADSGFQEFCCCDFVLSWSCVN